MTSVDLHERAVAADAAARDSSLAAPSPALRACVVIPAHDEQEYVARCVDALGRQVGVAPEAFEVLLVLDDCHDETEARAREAARAHPRLTLHLMTGPAAGAGAARKAGMDVACRRLHKLDRDNGLIACTDADTTVAPDWLAAQMAAIAAGARAVGGRIELNPEEAAALPPGVLRRRAAAATERMAKIDAAPPDDLPREHWQFSGASMAVTAEAYVAIGGIAAHPALEDEAFERRLQDHGIAIARPLAVRVRTSARIHGRARRGLAHDLALADWLERRSYHGDDYGLDRVRTLREAAGEQGSVSVVLPTREVAGTIGEIVDVLVPLRDLGVIDELLVIDAASADGTAEIAAAHGATVVQESTVLPEHGPARGKGDALWRSLAVTSGELVAFLDADTEDFHERFALGLLGPLLEDPTIRFLKGAFRRPFRIGDRTVPDGGGRVTELVARPLLNLHVPELAGFVQPLAGEFAGRRSLLEALPFPVGYGVEIATLIDALRLAGLDALAQVDLGTRQNRHQSLRALSGMAYAVMVAAERRIHGDAAVALASPGPLALPRDGDLELQQIAVDERPPLQALERAA